MANLELNIKENETPKSDVSDKEISHLKIIKSIYGLPQKFIEKNKDFLVKNKII